MALILDGTQGVNYPGGGGFQSIALTAATDVASTSGTAIDFTGIPAGAKRITILFRTVGTSGGSNLLVQLGAGSIVTTGYSSSSWSANATNATSTAGLLQTAGKIASGSYNGMCVIALLGSNIWVESHNYGDTSASLYTSVGGGSIALAGTLDRVRITTVNGTDTFNAGRINILYE